MRAQKKLKWVGELTLQSLGKHDPSMQIPFYCVSKTQPRITAVDSPVALGHPSIFCSPSEISLPRKSLRYRRLLAPVPLVEDVLCLHNTHETFGETWLGPQDNVSRPGTQANYGLGPAPTLPKSGISAEPLAPPGSRFLGLNRTKSRFRQRRNNSPVSLVSTAPPS